jgi:Gnt-I system high-affinity gluconate transporter
MPLIIVLAGICLLLLLILLFKVNSFLSFIIVSLIVALAAGMSVDNAVTSIEKGIGNTMSFILIILCFGAMLGKIVSESGAAQRITTKLVSTFGRRYIQWALMLTGFIVGISLFYEVGFFVMIPLIFTVAVATGLPLLYVGLPMLAALSVTHGFLPPHPAPTAIVAMLNADLGKTLLYGMIVAVPAIVISGPLLSRAMGKIDARPINEFVTAKSLKEEEMPGFWVSFFTALMPVILITIGTVSGFILNHESIIARILGYIGNPVIAMLLSVLFGIGTLGLGRGRKLSDIMGSLTHSVVSLTVIILIIAGAGALKQVLVDGGISKYIGELLSHSSLSPLILGWLIATLLRFCVGSATVAGITAAGIILPLIPATGVKPELMVLAIGSGSLMLGHVNDAGFWLFKEYFNLSVRDTLRSWTVMETSIGISGLIGVLLLNLIV